MAARRYGDLWQRPHVAAAAGYDDMVVVAHGGDLRVCCCFAADDYDAVDDGECVVERPRRTCHASAHSLKLFDSLKLHDVVAVQKSFVTMDDDGDDGSDVDDGSDGDWLVRVVCDGWCDCWTRD